MQNVGKISRTKYQFSGDRVPVDKKRGLHTPVF
jgi:hypothetical protein